MNLAQGTNSLNLHAVLYSTSLFCKTRPPVSFVMSKFQKQNVALCKPTKNKEYCGGF